MEYYTIKCITNDVLNTVNDVSMLSIAFRNKDVFELLHEEMLENGLTLRIFNIRDVCSESYSLFKEYSDNSPYTSISLTVENDLSLNDIKTSYKQQIYEKTKVIVENIEINAYKHFKHLIPYDRNQNCIYCDKNTVEMINRDTLMAKPFYSIQVSSNMDMELIRELKESWNFNITNEYLMNNEYYINITNQPEEFSLLKSLEDLQFNEYIRVRLCGSWQMYSISQKPYIYYAAALAYSYNPIGNTPTVNKDFSISIDVFSEEQYKTFKINLTYELSRKNKWSIFKSDSLTKAVVQRYFLQLQGDTKSVLMVDEGKGYIIAEASPDITFDLEEEKIILEDKLKEYFQICNRIYTINGEVSNINELSLSELLRIVYTENQPVQCYDKLLIDQMREEGIPLNSIFTEEIEINRYKDLRAHLEGYYTFGPIKGLMEGKTDFTCRLPGKVSVHYTNSEATQIMVMYKSTILFEIAHNDLEEVREVSQVLWTHGWFLNRWAAYYYSLYGKLSVYFLRNINFLRENNNTFKTGKFIMKMLKIAADNIMRQYEESNLLETNTKRILNRDY